ncbi:MAG: HD family phosphohydrolase [Syntrophales bacterium]
MNLLKNKQPAAVEETQAGKKNTVSRLQIVVLVLLLIPLSLFMSTCLTPQSHFSAPVYETGDIARADIVIPMDAVIEDETATNTRRAEARAKAAPVYRFYPTLQDGRTSRLKAAFARSRVLLGLDSTGKSTSGRTGGRSFRSLPVAMKDQLRATMQNLGIKPPVDDLLVFLVREGFPASLEDQIVLLLKETSSALLIPDDTPSHIGTEGCIHKVNTVTGKVDTVAVSLLSTLAQARGNAGKEISRDSRFAAADRTHVHRIVSSMIVPNLTFDESLTKARQEEEGRNVDHVLRKLKKGKIVLRQGDEVRADHLVQIEAIRKLSPASSSVSQTIGTAFLIGVLLTIFIMFVRFFTASQWSYLKLVGFLILTLTVNLLLLKALWFVSESLSQSFFASPFSDKTYYVYLLPFACGSMLVTLLAGERCAQIFTIVFCVLAGQSIGTDSTTFFYILITNLIGIIAMRKATQRIGIIGAGFKLGLSAAGLFFILRIAGQAPLDLMNDGFGAALAFVSGLLNAIFLVFMLPLCERIFMVTTEMRLSELGNLNLALIRELILKAPGTYNHSIAVGTLCEGAAKAIGLNPLFSRIASLYHDIGKTSRPEYFMENQRGSNPHDDLSPQESVHILEDHVTGGISIARRANLPSSLADMIPQHHGTKLMRFFYEKAKRQAAGSGGDIREEQFRYAGPKPQTKAAAILMLADGIEAAARTLSDHSPHNLLDLIRTMITDAMEDGQLSECDLTLSEINRVTYSFLETLSNYYHGRIAYPGFDLNRGSITMGDSQPIKRAAIIRK